MFIFAGLVVKAKITAFVTAHLAGKTIRAIIFPGLFLDIIRYKYSPFKSRYCIICHTLFIFSLISK